MRNVTVVVLSKDPVEVDSNNGELGILKQCPSGELTRPDDIVDSLFTYVCDVSDYKQVKEVSERVLKEVGRSQ